MFVLCQVLKALDCVGKTTVGWEASALLREGPACRIGCQWRLAAWPI